MSWLFGQNGGKMFVYETDSRKLNCCYPWGRWGNGTNSRCNYFPLEQIGELIVADANEEEAKAVLSQNLESSKEFTLQ